MSLIMKVFINEIGDHPERMGYRRKRGLSLSYLNERDPPQKGFGLSNLSERDIGVKRVGAILS